MYPTNNSRPTTFSFQEVYPPLDKSSSRKRPLEENVRNSTTYRNSYRHRPRSDKIPLSKNWDPKKYAEEFLTNFPFPPGKSSKSLLNRVSWDPSKAPKENLPFLPRENKARVGPLAERSESQKTPHSDNNLFSYNNVLAQAAKEKNEEKVLEIYSQIINQNLRPNIYTFHALMKLYVELLNEEKVVEVIAHMDCAGIQLDKTIYNMLIELFVKQNNETAALGIFYIMVTSSLSNQQVGIEPDEVTYNTLLKLYVSLKEKEKVEALLETMNQCNIKPNVETYTILLDFYAELRDESGAESVIKRMVQDKIEPNNMTYNTLLKLYIDIKNIEKAEITFDEMPDYMRDAKTHYMLLQLFNIKIEIALTQF